MKGEGQVSVKRAAFKEKVESKCNDSEGEQVKLKTNSLDVAGKA